MKGYLFIDAGEVRQAKCDEFYTNCYGEIFRVEGTITSGERNVVTRHEINIPDGAERLTVFPGSLIDENINVTVISLPHPKKKVKKWEWIVGYTHRAKMVWEHKYCTEDEIKDHAPGADWYHKIDETETEVEE